MRNWTGSTDLLTSDAAVIATSPETDWIAPAWLVTLPPAVTLTLPCAASVAFRFWTLAAFTVSVLPAAMVAGVCFQLTDCTIW